MPPSRNGASGDATIRRGQPSIGLEGVRDKAILTPEEAGALLGCSGRTVHRLVEAGEIPGLRLGRRLVIPTPKLLEMLGDGATRKSGGTGERVNP